MRLFGDDDALGFTRVVRDQALAEAKLPAETRRVKAGRARGWLYPVASEQGDAFQLFAWFDGDVYQVKVVRPELDGAHVDLHACHLFSDGRICFGTADGGGLPTLEAAYAKSVLWCNGFSAFRREGRFPF
ncbi:MAG TPA: hypothetical protein VFP65_04435 [Anaeromyxobacteraceae bacterium]|nr:hypothetical protein [Anaeromyxobacteraceae bacterium]